MTGRKRRGVWKRVAQPFVAAGVGSSLAAAEDASAAATAAKDGTDTGRWAFTYMPLIGEHWAVTGSYKSRNAHQQQHQL